MPAQYDFDDIVHNASNKYGVKLGSLNGFRNALDAHNNIESSYEIKENKMKKKYTKKQILESIAYWKKQLKIGNYHRMNENTDIDWTKYMIKTAGDFVIGLEDDSPNLKAVFVVNAIIPRTTSVRGQTWYDSNDNEHILPSTTIDLDRVFEKYEIDIECVVSDVRIVGGKVLIVLDEPYISDGKDITKIGLSVGEVLAAVRMAKPNAEIIAAFANDLSKTVKILVEFRNDACYELYPEGWGKNNTL